MRIFTAGLSLWLATATLCTAEEASSISIGLVDADGGGTNRVGLPVSGGIPFPRGVLTAPRVRLADSDARPVPLQSQITARWPDGSIQWLLLDFLAAGEGYRLMYHAESLAVPPPEHPQPIRLIDKEGRLVLENGLLRLEFRKQEGGIIEQVWRDRQPLLAKPVDSLVRRQQTDAGPYQEENYMISGGDS